MLWVHVCTFYSCVDVDVDVAGPPPTFSPLFIDAGPPLEPKLPSAGKPASQLAPGNLSLLSELETFPVVTKYLRRSGFRGGWAQGGTVAGARSPSVVAIMKQRVDKKWDRAIKPQGLAAVRLRLRNRASRWRATRHSNIGGCMDSSHSNRPCSAGHNPSNTATEAPLKESVEKTPCVLLHQVPSVGCRSVPLSRSTQTT